MSRSSHHVLTLGMLCALVSVAGCEPQLGLCEVGLDGRTEAEVLVFDQNGYPAYAGQAMTQQACSSCHSAAATGPTRRGAPAHLNFDAVGSRTPDPTMPDEEALLVLAASRNISFDHRHSMFGTVEAGTMPPGEAGKSAQAPAGYAYADGTPLPSISSAAGQEIYRTWLSCGSPMVERSADATGGQSPGTPCTGADVGDHCYYAGSGVVIEPTWTSIYDNIIAPDCVDCHVADSPFFEASQLDLSDRATAYSAMVGVAAMGSPCATEGGADRIVPDDADASLLVHKLENGLPDGGALCGDRMPFAAPVPESQIAIVRQWIDEGALDN